MIKLVRLQLLLTISEISSWTKKWPSWQSSILSDGLAFTINSTPLLLNPQTPLGGKPIYFSFLRAIISGMQNSLIRVPIKRSSSRSLVVQRTLDKIPLVILVPDKVRRLSPLNSPPRSNHEPSKKWLLKKSTAISLFAAANRDDSCWSSQCDRVMETSFTKSNHKEENSTWGIPYAKQFAQ